MNRYKFLKQVLEVLFGIAVIAIFAWSQIGVLDAEFAYRDALLEKATQYGE